MPANIMGEGLMDKFIDRLFAMKKSTFILLGIFIFAFILRLIAAINLTISADDMHFVTHAINFFSEGRLVTYDQSAGLWFAFTSFIYNLLGTTQIASRVAALMFGSFSIFAIYLLSKEFFDEKVSMFSAFLLAIAPFHIRNTVAEMDVMTMFFVLLAVLFFVRGTKGMKIFSFALSGIFLGLAIYTKVYPLLLIPSLLLYFAYRKKNGEEKVFSKKNGKILGIFLVAAFVFALPALAHNYNLYQNKGFLDLQFTRTFGLGKNVSEQYYGWDHQFNAENDWKGLILGNSPNSPTKYPTLLTVLNFLRVGDPINFYLGLAGIALFAYTRKNREYLWLFLLMIVFALPFLASIILLPKHYLFINVLMIPFSAFLVSAIDDKASAKLGKRTGLAIGIIIAVISLILLGMPNGTGAGPFYGKSHIAQLIDFKETTPESSLFIVDSRIYRGRTNWAMQGRPYLEAADLITIQSRDDLPGNDIDVSVYFVECIPDDCGWGTIKNDPRLNSTMESLVGIFQKNGELVKTISEPNEESNYYPFIGGERQEIVNIYETRITLKDSVVAYASQPKSWFLYPIGYSPKNQVFDNYEPQGLIQNLLEKTAHLIVLIAVILVFLSPLFVMYLIINEQ